MLLKKKKQHRKIIGNLKAAAIFSVALLLLSAVFYLNNKFEENRKKTNKETFCRAGSMPEITAILVDHTDNFTPLQQEALRKLLRDIALGVQKNGMIELYSVHSIRAAVLVPEFSLCNPGSDDDLENRLARRASTVRRNYEQTFVKKLDTELTKILTADPARESPIMESIQSVIVTAFVGREKEASKKTLVIVSDLLEHTPQLSFLKNMPDFEEYQKTSHWQNIRSELRNVNIKVMLIRRERGQPPKLLPFWQRFFENQNATFLPAELI